MASTSLPGIFPPQRIGDLLYLDGPLSEAVPLKPAVDAGADILYVLAVRTASPTPDGKRLASEVDVSHVGVGLDRPSVINCNGIHTVSQRSLTTLLGRVSDDVMRKVCGAVSCALGC